MRNFCPCSEVTENDAVKLHVDFIPTAGYLSPSSLVTGVAILWIKLVSILHLLSSGLRVHMQQAYFYRLIFTGLFFAGLP